VHQGNDLGYGKNAKDWIIRSQVLRALCCLRMQFNDYMAVGSEFCEIYINSGLKIESGPPEMEPKDERPSQPRAFGGCKFKQLDLPYHRDNWLVAAKRS
jgi:hypothetical protein